MSGRISMAIDGTLAIGKRGQMTTTFKPLPDLPLTKFVLRLGGAGAGTTPLAAARDLCAGHPADARARQTSHAGHGLTKYVPVRVSGCRKPKHKR